MLLKSRALTRTWLVFAAVVATALPAATPAIATVPTTATSAAALSEKPKVSALSTAKAAAGTLVTITGTALSTVTSVTFGATAATFVPQTTGRITRLVAVAPARAPGTVDVTVTNPAGTSAAGTSSKFTYIPPVPAVGSVTPSSGPTYKITPVVVKGIGFTGVTGVLAGGMAVAFKKVSATELKVTMPVGTAGARGLRIVTPSGTSTATLMSRFTYLAPAAPVITSIVPATGRGSVRTPVVVTGQNFTDSTKLTVGGVPVTYTKISATQVKALLPIHAAGVVDVQLTTPGGTTPLGWSARFTFVASTKAGVTKKVLVRK